MKRSRMRHVLSVVLMLAGCLRSSAGEAYYTGFENFTLGNDTIIGKESWTGTYASAKLHGVLSEAQHGVLGIGNAAFIGGYEVTTASKTSSGNSVYVRRPVNLDPVVLGQEVATFGMVFGIKDSSISRRDNFEVLIYNQGNLLLGGVQFDNTTLDTTTGKPRRLIYRLSWNGTAFQYFLTDYTFLPETLENLQFRINFKTNRWTASLSDVPVFQDLAFYTGSSTRNFGSVLVKTAVTTVTTTQIQPGDNYMLFDDYTVRTDAISTSLAVAKTAAGAAALAWNEEAGYTYQVLYSSDCVTWKSDLASSSHTAALTQAATFNDPTTPVPARRFYRIKCTYP